MSKFCSVIKLHYVSRHILRLNRPCHMSAHAQSSRQKSLLVHGIKI
jgi:hypothetical protein